MYALVIDDSSAMRKIIAKMVKRLGFEVVEACDGKEGVETLEAYAEEVSLVLVDWNMPRMNGLEFIQTVRNRNEFRDHKIIMVTTETEPARMAQALISGADEFVMKPFTEQILVEKLRLTGVAIPSTIGSEQEG